jgi:hypothetical protein
VFPVVIFFFSSLTAILLMGLLRLILLVGGAIHRGKGHGRMILTVVTGLVGPLAGLLLNRKVPFPADFQSTGVYLMATLNGLILLFPVEGPSLRHRAVWLAQCALLPFSAYFMVVFLPFLPLSLLAIIAMGSGLLMLVPLALFVIHAQQLAAGWRAVRTGGAVAAWTVAGIVALLLIPGTFVVRAQLDKMALRTALNYSYSPDYDASRFGGDRDALRRGLEHLRDFKSGLRLPFLSGCYSQIVFGGLVLPDAKLQSLYLRFFGEPLPTANPDRLGMYFSGQNRRNWGSGWRTTRPPTNTVELVSLKTTRAVEGDCETTSAKLVLRNTGTEQAEYATQVHLPAGVFVSGFWLVVNGERVAGRIFERKAALWVYESIRDLIRRDPGLLFYRDPSTVELRVFPFAPGETRTTELELIWPRGLEPNLRLADRALDTTSEVKVPSYVIASGGDQGRLLVASPRQLRASGSQPTPEAPYLHVIIDASAGADPAALAQRIPALALQAGAIHDVVVSAANYEFATVPDAPAPIEEAGSLAKRLRLPSRGAFCRDRALKCALAWHDKHAPSRKVVLGVITGSGSDMVVADEDLSYFAAWHPTVAGYLELSGTNAIRGLDFQHKPVKSVLQETTSLSVDGATVQVPLANDEPVAIALPLGQAGDRAITNERYRKGAAAWLRYAGWLRHPAGRDMERRSIVADSRVAQILTPLTSFIVVENSAQWRLLESKEKQKLKNHDELELEKAPEPSSWLLAVGLAVWVFWRRRLRALRRTDLRQPTTFNL